MRRVVGSVAFFAVVGGGFSIAEHIWGDSDKWGMPKTGECGKRLPRSDGQDDLVSVDCDDPTAQYRVVERYDNTTDESVCAHALSATFVFVYDGDTSDSGDEAVFCLAELAH